MLRFVVQNARQRHGWCSSKDIQAEVPGLSLEDLRETCLELETRGMIESDGGTRRPWNTFMVSPTPRATALLKGYPIADAHLSVSLSLDTEVVAQLVEALASLNNGQAEVVQACSEIAAELRRPPQSSSAERLQAASSILSLALQASPLFSQLVLPLLNSVIPR